MKTIVFESPAAKQFDALPEDAKTAVESALTRYAIDRQGDVKRLAGAEGSRLRVGNYRVLFDESETSLFIVYIGRRTTTTYH